MLTKEKIAERAKVVNERELPDGVKYYLSPLPASFLLDLDGKDPDPEQPIILSMCDKQGKPLYQNTPEDRTLIRAMSVADASAINGAILALNNLSQGQAEKN